MSDFKPLDRVLVEAVVCDANASVVCVQFRDEQDMQIRLVFVPSSRVHRIEDPPEATS